MVRFQECCRLLVVFQFHLFPITGVNHNYQSEVMTSDDHCENMQRQKKVIE